MSQGKDQRFFTLAFPGGGVARIPEDVVAQYMQKDARAAHPHREGEEDVVAHSLSVDPVTGVSDWHLDWEYGDCDYTDETGFLRRINAWHRHPMGTEYSEIYMG